MPACLIGLGANLGHRRAVLEAAVLRLSRHPQITLVAHSAWRETAPVGGPPEQPRFLNGAALIETALDPHALLALLQEMEDDAGRRRDARWGPRTLDLDLLLYGEAVLDSPALMLPHPRMAWRRFVIEPAAEIAGDMRHPTTGWSIARLLEHMNASRPYVAVTGPIGAGKTRLAEQLVQVLGARPMLERPDWDLLDAFYADPAGRGRQTESAILRQRAALLAADDAQWSAPRWTISDFWFEQSAAFARAWLSAEQWPAYLEEYETLQRRVARPRLIVLLDAPTEELLARVRRRGRPCERCLTGERLDRIRHAVIAQASRGDVGPVLRGGGEPAAVFADVLAAVRGME